MSGEGLLRHEHSCLRLPRRREAPVGARSLGAGRGVISASVLNEFTNVARRKWQKPWQDIDAAVGVIRIGFPEVVPVTVDTHASALALARDHDLSFYDALIVASAQEVGCDTLYSEDLQAGRRFLDLAVVNPFEV